MQTKTDKLVAAILVAAVIIISLASCTTQKNSCGDYYKWEAKTKFRSK